MAKFFSKQIPKEEKKLKLVSKYNKSFKASLIQNIFELINLISFYFILSLIPKYICSSYIKIRVNAIGIQKFLSDEYRGCNPTLSNGNSINDKSYNFQSITIEFQFNFCTISNFSYMFSNLKSLTHVKINDMFNSYVDLSYMFKNCINLKEVTFTNDNNKNNAVKDMRGMFYNCQSLTSFSFDNLYMDDIGFYYYPSTPSTIQIKIFYYHAINMSYMFYNCTNLGTISRDSKIQNISDMSYMFYNCISLTTINLEHFITGVDLYIDLSYMFYNCQKLKTITFNTTVKSFGIKNIKYMFYNCLALTSVKLKHFRKNNAINSSYLFYNCQSLTSIEVIDNYLSISDAIEMFYNCIKLTSINFNPDGTSVNINMTKKFYNCKKLEKITLKNGNNFQPNDMSYMFYNCVFLISIDLNNFKTDKVKNMVYMLYNCKKLTNFYPLQNNFENTNIINMRGIFQNCELIESLDLTKFYTHNVIIMWDMFKGCSSLINLNIPHFDTSKVTDMQSMFSGCKSLISLNLNHFNTTLVQYMNEMFQDCENLKYLSMSQLISDSLGTMYRMFYGCRSLEYLNLFPLIENVESINEMFSGTSDNFIICINDKANIPNIFEIIKNKNITRDCSDNCYGPGKGRYSTVDPTRCCPLYYNGNCYYECPGKTRIDENNPKICKRFNCNNRQYYNLEQNNCIDQNMLIGYYVNDTIGRTIDKCHEDCTNCYDKANDISKKCLKCKNDNLYVYLGNCQESCRYGFFIKNGTKICKFHRRKCKECTEESLKHNLCITCNEQDNYYPKNNDNSNKNGFINCYKEPEGYYLDSHNISANVIIHINLVVEMIQIYHIIFV